MEYEEILMAKISWYYYIEGVTQQRIADMLDLPRARVIKLLEKAKKSGVVQLSLRPADAQRLELEQALRKTYGLQDALAVPDSVDNPYNHGIAHAAAMYLVNRVKPGDFFNLGYSATSSQTLGHLASMATGLSCIALTGGPGYYPPKSTDDTHIYNVNLQLVPAPFIVSCAELATALRAEPALVELSRMIPHSAYSLVGIGSMDDTGTLVQEDILTKSDYTALRLQGAVGEILCHFIDENGNLVHTELEDRLISYSLDRLARLKNVIGVAAGAGKVPAIKAAMKGGYIKILITDESTANALLA